MSNFYGDLANSISDADSDVSEVDPAELAKIGDMDELDSELFGSSKKQPLQTSAKKSQIKSALKASSEEVATRIKPKVSFGKSVDFDESDPLADLLSDEDEFLFDKKKPSTATDKLKTAPNTFDRGDSASNSPNKKNILKSKDISALFGLSNEEKTVTNINPPAVSTAPSTSTEKENASDWLGLSSHDTAVPPSEAQVQVTVPKKPNVPRKRLSITFDDDDILSSMGFGEVQKTKNDTVLSSVPKSDDLKSGGDAKGAVLGKVNEPSKVPASSTYPDDILSSKESSGGYTLSMSREPRRNIKRGTSGIADPLGLFSTPVEPKTISTSEARPGENTTFTSPKLELRMSSLEQIKPRSPRNASNIKDTLGLFDTPVENPVATQEHNIQYDRALSKTQPDFIASPAREKTGVSNLPTWLGGTGTVKPTTERSLPPAVESEAVTRSEESFPAVGSSGIGADLAIGSLLDQQTAAALERQEMQLQSAVHQKHHEHRLAALQHRQQLSLERQEHQLQTLLDRQTERQRRVEEQMVAQQERIGAHIRALMAQPVLVAPDVAPPHEQRDEERGRGEEAEREVERMRAAVEVLKEKHREEIAELEESHKRQLQLRETERENIEEGYQSRIVRLEQEFASTCEQHKVKLATLQEERLADLQQLREVHRETVADLKTHQATMLEHLSRSMSAESTARQHVDTHANTLDAILAQLTHRAQDLTQAQAALGDSQQVFLDARDAEIRAQKVQIEALRDAMSKQRQWSDEERNKLLSLVTSLEALLNTERARYDEERWSLKQEAVRVEAKLQAVERERERSREQVERDRNEIKVERETMLHEAKQTRVLIEEEKKAVAAEKARLATLARLHGETSQKTEVEVEAALQAACQAKRDAEQERAKMADERDAVARERGRLETLERDLTRKARDLDNMTQLAVDTREDGLRALDAASQRDRQQMDLAASIQIQLMELTERKRQNVEESQRLSQERLRLSEQKMCTFCQNTFDPRHERPTLDKTIVDPKLLLLRLQMDEESIAYNPDSYTFASFLTASK